MKSYFQRAIKFLIITSIALLASLQLFGLSPAQAGINDDRLDGNIFVVYAGNGSLIPSKITLAESLKRQKPVILVYYLDDSRDCKQFALIVSRMQEFYGKAASIIAVSVDSLPSEESYLPNEIGYYYQGVVPQTVILDRQGKMVYNGKGVVKYEAVDDVLREVFDLLPRSKSATLKRRSFNEFNEELVR